MVALASLTPAWNLDLLKDTVIWFLTAGVVLMFRATSAAKEEDWFLRQAAAVIKLTVLMPRLRPPHDEPKPSPKDASVTATVARRVAAGREAAFEEWVQGIMEAAAKFPGFLGAGALRPPEAGLDWHVVYRFADADKLRAWETSAERAAFLARTGDFTHETGTTHVSGLGTWFTLPGRTAPAPPKWRMAVVTFAAVYPMALLGNVVLAPRTASWPLLLQPIVFGGFLVAVMTWIVMPQLTRLLRRWLYPR